LPTIIPQPAKPSQTFQPLSSAEIEQETQARRHHVPRRTQNPFAERARRMLKAADILERDKEKFAHLMTLENGASPIKLPSPKQSSAPPPAATTRECRKNPD